MDSINFDNSRSSTFESVIFYDKITGRIVEQIHAYGAKELDVPENCDVLQDITSKNILQQYVDIETKKLVDMPSQPTKYHVFDFSSKIWIDTLTEARQWNIVRATRDKLLAETDWTQLPDVPLSTKELWATYRQTLRDITLQNDPFNIVWPTSPQ